MPDPDTKLDGNAYRHTNCGAYHDAYTDTYAKSDASGTGPQPLDSDASSDR